MSIPGPKQTLTLKSVALSSDGSGLPTLASPATVQTLSGSLQPLKQTEKVQFGEIGIIADSVFYVHKSQFTSSANEAKLIEGNILASSSVNYNITGIQYWNGGPVGIHYKVILRELK